MSRVDSLFPLVDTYGRRHNSLRLSVTDRCNIRCSYCMPMEDVTFQPHSQLLTFEELRAFVEAVVPLGIDTLRLTGGEPLLRTELPKLVQMLAEIAGVRDVALTTNGILLPQLAQPLRDAGLKRLNISLDAMDADVLRQIARRDVLDRVLAGIMAAAEVGFDEIRLNAVAMRGITESQIPALVRFATRHQMTLRFIEFMPLDAEQEWSRDKLLSGAEIRRIIESHFGPLQAARRANPSQPAMDFVMPDTQTTVGFINPVSEPFCHACNRLRLTADGKLRNCLFATEEWDVRAVLRGTRSTDQLQSLVRDCLEAKKPGHGIDDERFVRPERAMYQIGG